VVAKAIVRSALDRRESRGAHQRYDYPQLDPNLRVNFIATLEEQGEIQIQHRPVLEVPSERTQWVEEKEYFSLEGCLLE
jgi:succinate dehydrogenase / fumarate reductase flavoprotein subunit